MKIHKAFQFSLLAWGLLFPFHSHAQDDAANTPFEDFPDFDVQDGAPNVDEAVDEAASAPAPVPLPSTSSAPPQSTTPAPTDSTSSDIPLEEASSEELSEEPSDTSVVAEEEEETQENEDAQAQSDSQVPQNNAFSMGTKGADVDNSEAGDDVPDQLTVTAPSSPGPLMSQPTNSGDFGAPAESLFNSGETQYPDDIKALEQRLEEAESVYGDQRRREEGLGDPGENLPPSEQFERVPLRPPMSDANWLRWAGPMTTKEYKVRRGDSLWAVSERLFGNPYLWPKIWHLNARITNPHIIERGMKLSFNPGNPGSAPELAFRSDYTDPNDIAFHTLSKLDKKKNLLEIIDETLRRQISSPHPPFQFFMLDSRPKVLAEIPQASDRSGRVFWSEGDSFRTKLGDGVFPIARIEAVTEKFFTAYKTRWLGLLEVKGNRATLVKAFAEISPGDEVVQRRFQLSPLAIHNDSVGPEYRDGTVLMALQEGAGVNSGEGQMLGVRFPAIGLGPRPGALLDIQVGHNRKAKALLVDRDQRVGTLWILDGDQEVSITDKIF